MLDEEGILKELSVLLSRYANERQPGERFGDFTVRTGIVSPSQSVTVY